MAKKDNTLPIVIGAAVLGGGAYYAYKKGLFGKKGSAAVAAQNAADASLNNLQAAADNTQAAQAYNPLTNPNSYEGKVAFIQSDIGTTPDGNPGRSEASATNKAFKAKYGLPYGIISTSNINEYVAMVKNKKTLANAAAATGTATARLVQAGKVVNALKSKYPTGKGKITWVDNPSGLALLKKDALGTYRPTGKQLSVKKGNTINVIGQNVLSTGFIRFWYQSPTEGLVYFNVSPYSVTIF